MFAITDRNWQWKTLAVIAALYLSFFLSISLLTGHLQRLGDASLFFSSSDAQGYKLIADYFASFGHSERPDDYLLALRPFMFPLYLGLYHVIGIAGVEILQMIMNVTSLWLVFLAIKTLSSRSWIAAGGTTFLALTPSFNFLVFHGLTETLSVFLVCLFIALISDHFMQCGRPRLFLAALVVSVLLCIRPIVLPFWIFFMAYYFFPSLRERRWNVWWPILGITPVLVQLIVAFVLTGTATLSPSGNVALADWYFPVVYQEKEYGKFVGRKTQETEEAKRRYPELKDKMAYLINNYREAIKAYLYILIAQNLLAGSNFVEVPDQTDDISNTVSKYLQKWSIYLNRLFVCIHAIMLALMIWLLAFGRRWYEQKALPWCYLFAILLILPTGLAYLQGDRYILIAEPLWLVAHSVLVGLFVNQLKPQFALLPTKITS